MQVFLESAASSTPGIITGAALNSLVYLFGIKVLLKGLTWEGVISSWFLGTLIYAAFGPGAYSIVCIYFIVGSLVTKLKLEQKEREGIAEARSGRRGLVCCFRFGLILFPIFWRVFIIKLNDVTVFILKFIIVSNYSHLDSFKKITNSKNYY